MPLKSIHKDEIINEKGYELYNKINITNDVDLEQLLCKMKEKLKKIKDKFKNKNNVDDKKQKEENK